MGREKSRVMVRLSVEGVAAVVSALKRVQNRGRNRRRRRRWRWLCRLGFHWWESDVMNDWRVIEETCCRCGKKRTRRFKMSVLK